LVFLNKRRAALTLVQSDESSYVRLNSSFAETPPFHGLRSPEMYVTLRDLRARAHHLQPVVMIGDAGLTPRVLAEVETNLRSHELIKIRVLGEDRASRRDLLNTICAATGASPVQQIGRILVIYRPKPPESEPKPAPRPRKRPARKTKRA
jgi:putative YhbY family RNA-binding protein